jgi:hypothetical protein
MSGPYSPDNPSPRYRELLAFYKRMHEDEDTFSGLSLAPRIAEIKGLIDRFGARAILDYGAGKGLLHGEMKLDLGAAGKFDSLLDYWGIARLACYDPAHAPFAALPLGPFDGVVCTDVLEHCPEEDLPWILSEIFSLAGRFVYANVACYPAAKTLPDGANAHCTLRPPAWWELLIGAVAGEHPEVGGRIIAALEPSEQGGKSGPIVVLFERYTKER